MGMFIVLILFADMCRFKRNSVKFTQFVYGGYLVDVLLLFINLILTSYWAQRTEVEVTP